MLKLLLNASKLSEGDGKISYEVEGAPNFPKDLSSQIVLLCQVLIRFAILVGPTLVSGWLCSAR